MNKQEAKLILASYTLGNEPENDERFDEAAKIAKSDEELATWWKQHQTGDQLIRSKIAEFSVPDDLRAALSETLRGDSKRRSKLNYLRNFFAAAAAVALTGYLYFQYGIDRSDSYIGPLVQRAYEYSVDGPRLTYFNKDTKKIKDWLAGTGIELPENLPPKLLELEGIGCRPLKWSNEGVALMCFNADTVYHLFVAQEEEFDDFDATQEIGYDHKENGWSVSKWRNKDYVFVLTAKTTQSQMSSFLASYTP